MAASPELALSVALLALAGVLVTALVAVFTSRRRAEVDRQLLLLKTQLEGELTRIQQAHDQRMKEMEHLLSARRQDRELTRNADRARLASLLQSLQQNGVVQFLKEHDFGGTFHLDDITPLRRFLDTASDPDKEFLDDDLQSRYMRLVEAARSLSTTLATKTWTNRGDLVSVLPEEDRGGVRPRWVDENATELNELAKDFVGAYDQLVREARSQVGSQGDV